VYVWLWRRLPGPWIVRVLEATALLAAVLALLFLVVFPWVEPRLPFTDVTVEDSTTNEQPADSVPSGVVPQEQNPAIVDPGFSTSGQTLGLGATASTGARA
jgi:hypothetical protein